MKKISFSWKPTISGREHWRLGLYMIVADRKGRFRRLRIMVRGVLLWMLGLAAAGYLALTTAWFFVLNERETNYVTWTDCVLAPARWDEIKRKRGDAYIDEGLIAINERKWSEAVLKLRAGLGRSPGNWKGRRSLGIFYLAAGQRRQGLNTLVEGISTHYQGRDAVELVLATALAGEDFDIALDLVNSCLAQSGAAVDRDREWLRDQKCRVLVVSEKHEAALAWIESLPQMSEVRHESQAVSLIELGRFEDARAALDEWDQGSGVLGGARRLSVRLARETGDLVTMRTELDEMQRATPLEAHPRLYAVIQEYLAGEHAVAEAGLTGYLMRFDSKAHDYELAATPLAEIEAWSMFDKLMAHAVERGVDSANLRRIQLDSFISRGQWEAAQVAVIAMGDEPRYNDLKNQRWLEMMAFLVDHLTSGDDGSRDQLLGVFRSGPAMALPALVSLAETLEKSDRDEAAFSLWEIASRQYPGSRRAERNVGRLRQVLGAREAVEIEIPLVQDGAALDFAAALPSVKEQDPELTAAMQSARRFERMADDLIKREQWSGLGKLIRELRVTNPVWISAHQDMVTRLETELNIVDRNWPALVSTLRFQLDGSVETALQVMKLARRLDEAGERRAAELVLAQVERRHPDFPPVLRIRAEWAPPEPDAKDDLVDDTTAESSVADDAPLPVR